MGDPILEFLIGCVRLDFRHGSLLSRLSLVISGGRPPESDARIECRKGRTEGGHVRRLHFGHPQVLFVSSAGNG
jgi:hypothetical protein